MTNRPQTLRSSVPGNIPQAGTRLPGELWLNFADAHLGYIDASQTGQKLLAVRLFVSTAPYATGDFVVYAGDLYRATAPSAAGAFTAANWTKIGTAQDLAQYLNLAGGTLTGPLTLAASPANANQAANRGYVDAGDATVLTAANTKLPLAGGTMTGPLLLSGAPTQALQAATKAYVDSGAFVPVTGGTMTGPLTLSGNATASLGAATLQQMQAADALSLPLTGGSLNGALTMTGTVAYIALAKSASSGGDNELFGYTGANARWLIQMGNGTAETGGNVGSDWALSRYSDAGAYIDSPINAYRSSGAVQIGAGGFGIGRSDGGSAGPLNGANIALSLAQGINVETSSGQVCILQNRIAGNGGIQSFRMSNAICGNISVANGNSATFNSGSDVRLKTDEHNDFDAGPILDAIQVYDFQWIESETRAYGVMAQECNEVFPDAVHHDAEEDWWGVDYSKFVPLLLQEIKALRIRVAQLEAMVIPR